MGTLKVDKIVSTTGNATSAPITLSGDTATFGDINMSSGKSIKNAAGTALLTEAGVLDNVSLGSTVTGDKGAWVKLQSVLPDNTYGSIVMGIVSGSTVFTSTYKVYKIIGSGLKSSIDNIQLTARYRQSGADVSVNYEHAGQYLHSNDSANSFYSDHLTGQSQIHLTNFIGGVGGENVSFEITIFDPAGTTNYKHMFTETFMGHKDGQVRMDRKWGRQYTIISAIEALRIYYNGGNFGAQGSISLYGVA
jgi:hypothetical protein